MTSNDHFLDSFHFYIHNPTPFVGSGFLVSHCELHKPRHFYGLSPLGTMSDHNRWVFHPGGNLSQLANTQRIFSFTISLFRVTHLEVVPLTVFTRSTPNAVMINNRVPTTHYRTPNTMSIYLSCTHTHLMCVCFPLHVYLGGE